MIRTIIESPYAPGLRLQLGYLNACIRDSLARGEAPFASHRMYTRALDDKVKAERILGIAGGQAWLAVAQLVAVYADLGISKGMQLGIAAAEELKIKIEYRKLGGLYAR